MKRVVLIMPNVSNQIELSVKKDPPMGILYIASALRNSGYEVSVIDAYAENLTVAEVAKLLSGSFPDYVGISCNYSPLHNETIKLAIEIKKLESQITIFSGGNHATVMAQTLLQNSAGAIDAICLGQGEKSVVNFIDSHESGMPFSRIQGIAFQYLNEYVENRKLSLIEELDELDFPAYDLVNMNVYDRYNIIASRGCPYQCTYCASNVIVNGKVRYRSAKNILDEVELLIENYGNKLFWFSDDTFTANLKFANALMDEIERRHINFSWSCLTRVNNTSKDLMVRMKKNGCEYISYGVESGNAEILSKMNKKISLSQIKNTIKMTKEVGLRVYTFFLIGYPGDSKKSIEDSFELIKEIQPDGVSYAVVIPLPGTPMWKELCSKDLINCEEIKWDYLFAKTGRNSSSERYAAELASNWCEMTADEIIDLYEYGNQL